MQCRKPIHCGFLLILLLFTLACHRGNQSLAEKPLPFFHKSYGEGNPIIVIHGGPGLGSSYLEDHLRPLSEHSQVIFYDQRSSGRSPVCEDSTAISLQSFLSDIDDIRRFYNHDKVAVLGHSWGGLLAMQYAINYPTNTSNLILLGSNAPSSEMNNSANQKLAERFSDDDMAARQTILSSEAFANQLPEAYEELMMIGFNYQFADSRKLNQLTLNLPEDFGTKNQTLSYLFKDFASYDYTNSLVDLSTPALILYGLKDAITPTAVPLFSGLNPKFTVQVIDDAGHFPFIEKPKETLGHIVSFLSDETSQ